MTLFHILESDFDKGMSACTIFFSGYPNLKHSDLFEALPKAYYDAAFLDRLHAYIPGWEIQKLRNEMFTDGYGFIVDYLAEVLKDLRKEDYMHEYKKYFELSNSITTRDKDSISKTFSGLVKVIYPHGIFSEDDAKELLDIANSSDNISAFFVQGG